MTFHDSQKEFYRSPFGAQSPNTEIKLRIDVPTSVAKAEIRLWYSDGGEVKIPMSEHSVDFRKALRTFEGSFLTNKEPGWCWYYFIIYENNESDEESQERVYYYGDNIEHLGGVGQEYDDNPTSYQITVYDEENKVPTWTKDAIMYHIFVDRFSRGQQSANLGEGLKPKQVMHPNWNDEPLYTRDDNGDVLQYDFFGGDLQGILEKLPYLADLGVNIIYLSPIMESISNHKYDVGNYKKVDEAFGSEEDFINLTMKAHSYGMKVILDGVFSHTGADSIYFNQEGRYDSVGAAQSQESPYSSWYNFKNFPDEYDCWWGMKNLPNVNEEDPGYLDYIIRSWDSVVAHWHNLGIDGWRLDVADELPQGFLELFYKRVKELNPEALVLGEVWEDATRKEGFGGLRPYVQGKMLDSVMNYPFRDIVIGVLTNKISNYEGLRRLKSLHENYPKEIFYSLMNLLSSHDERRILTELGEAPDMSEASLQERQSYRLSKEQYEMAKERLKMAILWQMTFPGMPDIYYGDEAGLEGDTDPFNRRTFPWGYEDKEIQKWYKKMAELRNRWPVLRSGDWHSENLYGNSVLTYSRTTLSGVDVFGEKAPKANARIMLNTGDIKENYNLILGGDLQRSEVYSTKRGEITLINFADYDDDSMTDSYLLEIEPGEGVIVLTEMRKDEPDLECNLYDEASDILSQSSTGVLMHITSLPARDGIGDLGPKAYEWVDLLAKNEQKYWQILPLTEPALGNSPYTAFSAIAGDTRILSLDEFIANKWLTKQEVLQSSIFVSAGGNVNVEAMLRHKEPLMHKAWLNFLKDEDAQIAYNEFCEKEANWLDAYALFYAKKKKDGNTPWNTWGDFKDFNYAINHAERYQEEMDYMKFLQWQFSVQWDKLHEYARSRNIKIVGDLPFFMAYDSADVWSNPEYFDLDEEGNRISLAGVPPDYFAKDGQLWGNPQYNWSEIKKEDYRYFIDNIKKVLEKVDILRLDHFRGYEATWCVPNGETTAKNGEWVKGPGDELFKALAKAIPAYKEQRENAGEILFIAEDLGVITPEVEELRRKANMPGMSVLQFVVGNSNGALQDISKRIFYTGTHDNNTLRGWLESLLEDSKSYEALCKFMGVDSGVGVIDLQEILLEWVQRLESKATIVPVQDLLYLDEEHRMNVPGTVNNKNWLWRLPADYINRINKSMNL